MPRPAMTFWFDFASTYSYLSAARIDDMAAQAGVEVVWQPFSLGAVFKARGMSESPFNIFATKGRYMWRDMHRIAVARGLPFRPPPGFPQNSLRAARVALAALKHPEGRDYCRAIYRAQFAEGGTISDNIVIAAALDTAGLPRALVGAADDPDHKARLRAASDRALDMGLFGAPSFTVGAELFWGDDRLAAALDWATAPG